MLLLALNEAFDKRQIELLLMLDKVKAPWISVSGLRRMKCGPADRTQPIPRVTLPKPQAIDQIRNLRASMPPTSVSFVTTKAPRSPPLRLRAERHCSRTSAIRVPPERLFTWPDSAGVFGSIIAPES